MITALLLPSVLAQRHFANLKDARSNITFVPYTPQDRIQVAKSVEDVFSMYVNRQSKIDNYESQFHGIDPLPRAKEIQEQAGFLSDKEFHYKYADLFLSLRDFHTNYEMPAPHRCFTAVTAVSFTLVDSPDIFNNPEVVANGFSSFPQVISMSPEAKKISIGDTLESINGLSFKKYFELNQFKSGGANNSGGHRAALKLLSFRSGLLYPMPTEDLVKLTLKSAASGKSYSVTLPWIAASRDACIEEARPVINGEVVAPKPPPKHSYAKKQPLMDHPFQRDYDDSFQKMETSFKMTPTKDPIISWGIYAPKNLGIIYMDSFMPLDSDGEKVFLLIRDLLVNQLKDTSALVFDIRDNGGGLITMADVIPQLFISNYVNNNARALVSPLNEKLMKSGAVGEDWKHTYSQVRPGDIFTPPVQFDSDASSNLFGQAYFKPVGVLNNGNCYSACDLFSANMQDNSAAWIFGEDKETGAGGANVVEYNGFFSKLDPKLFKPMPYTDLLPTYHQDLRIGWRQTVRTGKNDGKLIEDIGIIADSVVRPTVEDIASKSSTTQWNRIAAKLSEIAKVKGTENLYFQASPQVNIQSPIASPLNFKLDVSGVSSVSLKGENQLTMVKLDVKPSSIKQEISLSTIPDLKKAGFYRLQITAKDAADKTVVETYRFLRLIPSEASFVTLTPSPVKMAIEGPGYAVFNKATADANGWKADGAMLRIGAADAKYADNVNSRLSIFANPSAPLVKCLFKATYDTEENFDFLHVGYVDESGEYDLLLAADKKPGVSGTGKVDESFVFQPKGKFELFAQFLSDGGVGQTGVVVETFEISNGATATSSIAVSSATLVPSATAAPEPSLGSVTRTVISASSGPVPTAPPTHPSDVPASPSSPSRPTEPSAPQGPPAQSYPVATPNPHPGIGYKKNYGMEGMYNAEPPSNVLSGADARPLAYLAYACLAVFVVL